MRKLGIMPSPPPSPGRRPPIGPHPDPDPHYPPPPSNIDINLLKNSQN